MTDLTKLSNEELQELHQLLSTMSKEGGWGKRLELVDKFGFDIKYAYHCVRLLNEVEQILMEGDLDLQRNNEQLKSIRRGEWTLEDVERYFQEKEKALEELYTKSSLRYAPDEEKIKQLLLNCLEHHYGSLANAITLPNQEDSLSKDLLELMRKHKLV